MNNETAKSGGIGFSSLLLLAFIILKLCKVIDWSWWWVMAPLWIPIVFVLIILMAWLIITLATRKKRRPTPKSKWQERLEEIRKKGKVA